MSERKQDIFELFEAYLQNQLSAEEKEQFEARLSSDLEFRAEFDTHQGLHEALKDRDSLDFRRKVQQIQSAQEDKGSPPKPQIWQLAATIALIIGLGVLIWTSVFRGDINLYEEYYAPYPVEAQMRGTENNEEETLKAYSEGHYSKAIKGLEEMIQEDPGNDQYRLYLGICYLETDKTENAISIFKEVNSDSAHYESALWYLALAYLKIDDMGTSEDVLKTIIEYDGIYREKAESLLFDIQSNRPDDS